MTNGIRSLLFSSAFLLLAPLAATSQEPSNSSDRGITITASAGLTSAYRGGETYLISALLSRPEAVPVEVAFEYTPAPWLGNAKIFWLGSRIPLGTLPNALYAGWRGGFVDGPRANGLLADLHFGCR